MGARPALYDGVTVHTHHGMFGIAAGIAAYAVQRGLIHDDGRLLARALRLLQIHRHFGRALVAVGVRDLERDVLARHGRIDVGLRLERVALAVGRDRHPAVGHFIRARMVPAFLIGAVLHRHRGAGRHVRSVGRRDGCRSFATFRHRHTFRGDRRHVVHHIHSDDAIDLGVVHIRHRHGQVMGDIVHAGAAMLRGVAAQFVGERQLARDRVEARHRQRTFIRGHGIARERALFEHHNAADHDGGHAVRRIDAQGAAGRGGRIILPSLRTIRQAGFVHRHHFRFRRRVGRRHHDAVVHAVDGDGHLAFVNVAVRIRIGVGEFFRQRLAIGKRLHRLIVVIERVAVGAVGVQRDFAILAALVRIPGEGCIGVRTGHRAFQRVAGDGRGIPFRHAVREALDGRPVVPDGQIQSDLGTGTVAVAVRHRQLHADAVERQDIIGIAVVGMNQGTVIFQGKGDIALAVDMHIEDFRITGHADDTAFIIDGQYDRHHLATDEGNKGILRAGIQREFIAAAGFTVRTGDDSEVVADIHDILNTCTMKIAFIQLQLRLTSRRHLHGVIFHLDLKLHLA